MERHQSRAIDLPPPRRRSWSDTDRLKRRETIYVDVWDAATIITISAEARLRL